MALWTNLPIWGDAKLVDLVGAIMTASANCNKDRIIINESFRRTSFTSSLHSAGELIRR